MATHYAQREAIFVPASTSSDAVALIARVLLAAMYLLAGLQTIGSFAGTASMIAAHGLPFPELSAAIGIVVDIGLGLAVLVGWQARRAALLLAIYTVVVGILFHAYWADTAAATRTIDFDGFWKNITIAGGFLMVFAFGAGRYSFERR
jgi:putative oxidoreductase